MASRWTLRDEHPAIAIREYGGNDEDGRLRG